MCLKFRLFGKRVKKKAVTESLERLANGYRKSYSIRRFRLRCPYDYEPTYTEKKDNTEK